MTSVLESCPLSLQFNKAYKSLKSNQNVLQMQHKDFKDNIRTTFRCRLCNCEQKFQVVHQLTSTSKTNEHKNMLGHSNATHGHSTIDHEGDT
jgi:hypothetical protein